MGLSAHVHNIVQEVEVRGWLLFGIEEWFAALFCLVAFRGVNYSKRQSVGRPRTVLIKYAFIITSFLIRAKNGRSVAVLFNCLFWMTAQL